MKEIGKDLNDKIENFVNKNGNKKVWIALLLIGLCLMLVTMFDQFTFELSIPKSVTYDEYLEDLKAGNIDTIYYDKSQTMRYTVLNDETRAMTPKEREGYVYPKANWRSTLYPGGEDWRREMLEEYHVNLVMRTFAPALSDFWSLLISIGVLIAVLAIAMMVIQKSTLGIGGKKFDLLATKPDTRFKDVIGQDEVLKDLQFIVDMMRGKKVDSLGARIPKGVLLSGPPGTGKTLIARAVAGEAEVPFFSANASEFIDMYVGVGPKTVRQLFREARKHKPCVIFIDEIDAVASTRGATGTTSEDNKTVNALLQEMDGFNKETGVFVIAATNNPDSLDKAIVRAGRFDRQVVVNPPKDWKVRKKLFDLYIGDTPCEADIENIARQTVGFTGADINAVCNETKLIAAMKDKKALDAECFEAAIDKKVFKANRSTTNDRHKKDIKTAAYHEAGHAVVTFLAGQPIARATIIGSTSGVGGVVFQADKNTSQFMTKSEYEWQIRICYGGRASEMVKFGDVSDGASSDITQATKLIYQYTCKVGMNKKFGMLDIDVIKGINPLALPVDEMKELAQKYMDDTYEIVRKNYDMVEAVAKQLLEHETLSGKEILDIIKAVKSGRKNPVDNEQTEQNDE